MESPLYTACFSTIRLIRVVVVIIGIALESAVATPLTAEDYLNRLAYEWQANGTLQTKVESTTRESNENTPAPISSTNQVILHPIPTFRITLVTETMTKDQDRFALRQDVYWGEREDETPALIQRTSHVWDGNAFYEYAPAIEYGKPRQEPGGRVYIRLDNIVGAGMFASHLVAPELLGYFGRDREPFYTIMQNADASTVDTSLIEVDGIPCAHIVSESKQGIYELWVEQGSAGKLRKARVTRNATHEFENTGPIVQGSESADGDIELTTLTTRVEELVLDAFAFLDVEGKEEVVAYRRTLTREFEEGGRQVLTSNVNATEITRNPDNISPETFMLHEVPDGTEAIILDVPEEGVSYNWSDGRLGEVKSDRIDEELLKKIVEGAPESSALPPSKAVPDTARFSESNPTETMGFYRILSAAFSVSLILAAVVAYMKLR